MDLIMERNIDRTTSEIDRAIGKVEKNDEEGEGAEA